MKIQTKDLQGTALDWAVGVAHEDGGLLPVAYSTDWKFGGEIVEVYGISVGPSFDGSYCEGSFAEPTAWRAYRHQVGGPINPAQYHGPTPLIAAMRCYVASKLGDEVQVPREVLP